MINLLKFEISNIKNNINLLFNPSLFFIIIFVISIINIGSNKITSSLANAIFIIGMFLWSSIFTKHIVQNDYISGKIDMLFKYNNSHLKFIFSKFIVYTFISIIFYSLFYGINFIIYGIEFKEFFKSLLAIILIIPSLTIMSIFTSCCVLNNKISEIYASFIVMPFVVPVIIFCQSMLVYIQENNDISNITIIMIGLNLINIILFGIMSNYMLRYNN